MQKTNFVFFGTPEVARDTLEILKSNGLLPSLVITAPDKPQGRKMIITPPEVKNWAIENNIPFIQPERITKEEISGVFDFFLVVAYGKILPEEILKIPKYGSINIHYSLLPKYRGASPVESAILSGENKTGVSIQKMEYKMDSGPIIGTEDTEIKPGEKTAVLKKRLIEIGAHLLIKVLPEYLEGHINPTEQNEILATFSKKIKKEDGLLNESDSEEKKYNKFRAYSTWPRTFFFQDGKRIIITDASLENGVFVIKKVIPEGKKEINYKDFIRS